MHEEPKSPTLRDRYLQAANRLEQATSYLVARGDSGSPTDLRVGVNSTFAVHDALVEVLIENGLIRREQYEEVLVMATEREASARVQQAREAGGLPDSFDFA